MNAPHPRKNGNGISLRLDDVHFPHVLAPVDFSAGTLETLRYAKTLADKSEAVVDVLHVIHLSVDRNEAATPRRGLIRTMSEGVQQELKKLVEILWESGVEATVSVREGRAHEVILHAARSTNAALTIMGTRNRSWLSGVLRRDTVKRVIKNSPCPVMVLRAGMTKTTMNTTVASSQCQH
ncbi:MAG: universal stress protein [Verrucomicrobia bacterium]|nr:universal stress protein [Verrucomicrobiota bacterium]